MNEKWRIGNRMWGQEVNISRVSGAQQGGEGKTDTEERERVKRGRGWGHMAISFD